MSSILKALKKLEEEKARQKGVQVDLVQNILRGEQQRSGEVSTWRLPALVLGLLLAGGLVGMLAVSWLETSSPSLVPVADNAPAYHETPAAPASQPAAPTPVGAGADVTAAASGASSVPAETPGTPARSETKSRPAPAVTPPVPQTVPVAIAPPVPVASPQPSPAAELLVSGIVYQDDPDGRIAVVNDLPVMQGNPVAGAVVEEILPDRVRFSRDGNSFEVLLEQ